MMNYGKTWFLIDVIAIFPFEIFEGVEGQANKLTKLLRLFKLTRILRLNRIANRAEDNVKLDTNTIRIGKLAFVMIIVWHFTACAYWYISLHEGMGMSNTYYNLTGKFDEWVAPRELGKLFSYQLL